MRKFVALGMALLMTASLALTGCGSSEPATSGGQASGGTEAAASSGGAAIRLVNNKVEIDAALKDLAAKYKDETGVEVTIESLGGGVDTQATLKGYYQAGNMPDIFVIEGDKDYPTWEGNLADLSGMEWTKDTDNGYAVDGVMYGFPTTTEAIGLAYNKSILDACGVDPESITSPAAMKAAFEAVDAKKDELGLTAVLGYCAEASQLYWSTGQHLFGTYIDEGLARDDTTYIDLLKDGGKLDDARIAEWAKMVQLFNEYSDPDLLVSGTYDQQVLNFTSGKYAFVTQGSWIGATMTDADHKDAYAEAGNFECGMAPYAFMDGQDTILTNTPNWWAVYKDGNVDEAKKFLEWCATNEGGQQILVEQCGFVSPYKSCSFVASDPFAQTIVDHTAAGKTSAWHWLSMKDGIGQNATGVVFQDFAAGNYTIDEFVETLKEVIEAYYAS
ncbi:MAG: carbohydrate ABC transporter substrate-binding protein [Lachnospiraceae bacterium]|jgi:raffinose/stachyose/melibiose transport system substrate-binding protein|nr:carbohydrate ABC transporter substrate-binding protein [Lachnospiraceae bacterium]